MDAEFSASVWRLRGVQAQMDQRLAVGLKGLIIFMLYSCVLSSFLCFRGFCSRTVAEAGEL